jgi:hypothetical protein
MTEFLLRGAPDFSDSGGGMKIRNDRKGDFLKHLVALTAVS